MIENADTLMCRHRPKILLALGGKSYASVRNIALYTDVPGTCSWIAKATEFIIAVYVRTTIPAVAGWGGTITDVQIGIAIAAEHFDSQR